MKKYTREELFKMDAVEVYKLVLKREIKIFPKGFWMQPEAKQNAGKCLRFLIEEVLNLSDEELKKQLSSKLLKKYNLGGMLAICFNESPISAIENSYPDKFKPWEFKNVGLGYWKDEENAVKAIKWLIEDKLKLSDKDLREQLSRGIFKKNNLLGMLDNCFNGSPYKAINVAYPDKFKPWEFKNVSNGYWKDISNVKKSIKWLIEEKLQLSNEELKEQLSIKLFIDNGLGGMMTVCFNGSPYDAINTAYPGKFKPWEFKYVGNGYWKDEENIIKAIKWLIEEKLKFTDEELKEQLSARLFVRNGLGSMLGLYCNYSPYEAINTAYPGKFKKEDFKNYR